MKKILFALMFLMICTRLAASVPSDLSGLVLWLDAGDSSTISLSGSNVLQWNDKSGGGHNATPGGNNNPQLVSGFLNGQNVIGFNGSNQALTGSGTGLLGDQQMTVLVVYKINNTAATQVPASFGSVGTNANIGLGFNNSGFFNAFQWNSSNFNFSPPAASWAIQSFTRAGGDFMSLFVNGLAGGAGGASGMGINGNYTIGREVDTSLPFFLNGYIAEVVVYNRALSTTERQAIEWYLAAKWGMVPDMLPNLGAWYDAADASTITLAGSNVTTWGDRSLDSRNATGGISPTYVTNSMNGHPVVRFDGSSQYLKTNPFQLFISNNQGLTVFTVFNTTTTSTQRFLINHPDSNHLNNNTNFELGYSTGAGTNGNFGIHRGNGNATVAPGGTIVVGINYLMTTIVQTTGSAPTNIFFYKNGASLVPHFDGSGWLNAGSYPVVSVELDIGARHDGNPGSFPANGEDSFHSGDIAEIIIYQRQLSDAERFQIESYLYSKWFVPSSSVPFQVPGLQAWFDVSDSNSMVFNGSNVAVLRDKSGFCYDGVQAASGSQPIYSATSLNSKPGITFDGSADNLISGINIDYTLMPKITVFTVYDDLRTGVQDALWGQDNGGWDRFSQLYLGGTSGPSNGSGLVSVSGIGALNSPRLYTLIWQNGVSNGSQVWLNGVSQTTFTESHGNSGDSVLMLGGIGSGGGQYSNSRIAEMLIYDGALTTLQRQTIESYLYTKWLLASATPKTISGLQLWLDGSDAESMALNGSTVQILRDKSGNAYDALQATGSAQPTLVSNQLNGHSLLRFDGLQTYLQGDFGTTLGTSGQTYIAVAKNVGGPVIGGVITGSGFSGIYANDGLLSDRYIADGNGGNGSNSSNSIRTTNQYRSVVVTYAGASTSGTFLYMDGGLEENFTLSGAGINPSTQFQMGARTWGGITNRIFNGDIGEVMIYNRVLSAPERQLLEQYLYNKWLIGTGTPKTIAGLVLWLDGSDRNSIVTSNTSVTLWRDKSGSSNDAPPGTSPVFIPSGINSKSVVRFDGSTQYLDIPFSSVLNPASFSVLFVVNVRGGVNTFRSPITSRAGFTAPNLKGYYFYADASNLWQFTVGNGNWNGFSATPASIGKPTLVAGIYSGAGSTLTGYVDGGLSGTTSSTLVVNPSSPTRIGAGASETSPNFFFNGDIAEIIIYNNSISAAQRQQLESYLRVKWGIGFNAPFFGVGF